MSLLTWPQLARLTFTCFKLVEDWISLTGQTRGRLLLFEPSQLCWLTWLTCASLSSHGKPISQGCYVAPRKSESMNKTVEAAALPLWRTQRRPGFWEGLAWVSGLTWRCQPLVLCWGEPFILLCSLIFFKYKRRSGMSDCCSGSHISSKMHFFLQHVYFSMCLPADKEVEKLSNSVMLYKWEPLSSEGPLVSMSGKWLQSSSSNNQY